MNRFILSLENIKSQMKLAQNLRELSLLRTKLLKENSDMIEDINYIYNIMKDNFKNPKPNITTHNDSNSNFNYIDIDINIKKSSKFSAKYINGILYIEISIYSGLLLKKELCVDTKEGNYHEQIYNKVNNGTFLITFMPESSIGVFSTK